MVSSEEARKLLEDAAEVSLSGCHDTRHSPSCDVNWTCQSRASGPSVSMAQPMVGRKHQSDWVQMESPPLCV